MDQKMTIFTSDGRVKLRLPMRARFLPGMEAAVKKALAERIMTIQNSNTIARMIIVKICERAVGNTNKSTGSQLRCDYGCAAALTWT